MRVINKHYPAGGNANFLYLNDRITDVSFPTSFHSNEFTVKVSFINTFNALTFLANSQFEEARKSALRNIDAGVAVEDDYMVLASVNLTLYDTDETNKDAERLLKTAKSLHIYPSIRLHKIHALALLRLGKNDEAKLNLENYKKGIEQQWDAGNNYVVSEYEGP